MSYRFASADRFDADFVTKDEQDAILRRLHEDDGMTCCKTLHIGIFFDGTRNNADRDRGARKESNVARLHAAFPIDQYHQAIYVAGVGTPFVEQIGDFGVGLQAAAGAAAGWAGEARINWALLWIHDILHAYVHGKTLTAALGKSHEGLVKSMSLDMNFKGINLGGTSPKPGRIGDIKLHANSGVGTLKLIAAKQNGVELTWDLDSNWAQLKNELDSSKWNAAVQEWDTKRRKVLLDRRAQLKERIGDLLVKGNRSCNAFGYTYSDFRAVQRRLALSRTGLLTRSIPISVCAECRFHTIFSEFLIRSHRSVSPRAPPQRYSMDMEDGGARS